MIESEFGISEVEIFELTVSDYQSFIWQKTKDDDRDYKKDLMIDGFSGRE